MRQPGPHVQRLGFLCSALVPRHRLFFFFVKCPRCFICAFGVENQIKEEKRGIYPEVIQQQKVALSTPRLIICCCCLVAESSPALLRPHGRQPARLLCPWDFPGEHTGVGCHFLLQGIFLTQRLNPSLLHWQVDSFFLYLRFGRCSLSC